MLTVGVITASDKGSRGERKDLSGKCIIELVTQKGYEVVKYVMLPDDVEQLSQEMCFMSDVLKVNLILTTGGTGFSMRDVTPEATLKVIHRQANGISEAIRYNSLQITKKAMLSRAISGIRNSTLIINLPGSPKAVKECLEYLLDPLEHGLLILKGEAAECAAQMQNE